MKKIFSKYNLVLFALYLVSATATYALWPSSSGAGLISPTAGGQSTEPVETTINGVVVPNEPKDQVCPDRKSVV